MSRFTSRTNLLVVALMLFLLPGLVASWSGAQAQPAGRLVQANLTDFVPEWVKEGGRSAMLQRIVDRDLRSRIEAEINALVAAEAGDPDNILLPDLGETVADWMTAFDQEIAFQSEIEPGQALFSFVNLNYEFGNTLYVDEFTVYDLDAGTVAFHHDFTGENGDTWSEEAFGPELFAAPRNPHAVHYSIENNVGVMDVENRREGSASSYGKLTPIMDDLDNSEVLMRFRVDGTGLTQYLRVWVQSDQFGSGSSFARNGFGIALHLGRDELTLQQRENASTNALVTAPANMTTDWHWLRLRAAHGKVAAKLWNDADEEPADWLVEYDFPEAHQQAALSFANLDEDKGNTLYIDSLHVDGPNGVLYEYDFAGADGADWDADAFTLLHSLGTTYTIEDGVGVVQMEPRRDMLNASYGKLMPAMESAPDSQLLMRFRVDDADADQWVKAFVRANEFLEGNSTVKTGFGVELNVKNNELTLFKTENKNLFVLGRDDVDLTTDWHWLRLHLVGEELAARLWKDGDVEPTEWNVARRVSDNVSVGEAIMRLLVLRGDLTTIHTSMGDS